MTNQENIQKEANLIIDCDEIIVDISVEWARRILENKEHLGEWLDIEILEKANKENKFREVVLSRNEFYLNKWLAKREGTVEEMLHFLDLYDQPNYYDGLKLTNMGINLAKLCYSQLVNKIYIVTRCTDKNFESKKRLIESSFAKSKTEIIKVNAGEKKSDAIKGIDLEQALIFDDELSNIKDYLTNCDVKETTFYIPKFGYNKIDSTSEIAKLADEKQCLLIYYDAI